MSNHFCWAFLYRYSEMCHTGIYIYIIYIYIYTSIYRGYLILSFFDTDFGLVFLVILLWCVRAFSVLYCCCFFLCLLLIVFLEPP